MQKPLEGYKVLDLTTYVAAPVCARLLSDMGAKVIKIEHPRGDGWREYGISQNLRFSEDQNPIFDIYNTGKEFISVNLKSQQGQEIVHKLLAEADIFVTNTRPAALKRLGLSYEELKERYPKLVYAVVLGYGEQGPQADLPAYDSTAYWTRSGFLRDMAPPTEHYRPIIPPIGVGDTATSYLLLAQICAALVAREKTGQGDYIRAGLYQAGIFTNACMEILSQKPWGKIYPRHWKLSAPSGCYECADGEWIYMSPGQLSITIPKSLAMIGRADLVGDPRFMDRDARAENIDALYEVYRDGFLSKTSDEWTTLAQEYDLPLMRMNHFSDVSEDEQAWANGYLERMTCPDGETVVMPASPIRMNSVTDLVTHPAPPVGEHTAKVLAELGYTTEEIAAMDANGAVFVKK